jgi:hypothetical protein
MTAVITSKRKCYTQAVVCFTVPSYCSGIMAGFAGMSIVRAGFLKLETHNDEEPADG